MDVILRIQDREALAVWTIPYVTGHYPSMDMIVDELAQPKEFAEVSFPQSFMLTDGDITYLPPGQWIDLQARMERLSEQVGDNHEEWRHQSIEIIRNEEPVYVWLDQFQSWFDWHVKEERAFHDSEPQEMSLSPRLPQVHADYFKTIMYQPNDFLERAKENADSELQAETTEGPAVTIVSQSKGEFEKRLDVLRNWMSANGFTEGCKLPKHYTREKVYNELGRINGNLFCSIGLSAFNRHFWVKQKLCELTRGRKDTVV
jgi:hypothetical protein